MRALIFGAALLAVALFYVEGALSCWLACADVCRRGTGG
jgi:hypothetical protein